MSTLNLTEFIYITGTAPNLAVSSTDIDILYNDEPELAGGEIGLGRDGSLTYPEDEGTIPITVTATRGLPDVDTDETVTLQLSGTATAGTDYNVVGSLPSIAITGSNTGGQATLRITFLDNEQAAGNRYLTIGGTADSGRNVGETYIYTIDDDHHNARLRSPRAYQDPV